MNQPQMKPMGPISDAKYCEMMGLKPDAMKVQHENEQKKPLNYKEYNALRYLGAVITILPLIQESLQKRCKANGKWLWGMLRSSTGILIKLFDALIKSVPVEKLIPIKQEMMHTHISVVTSYSEERKYEDRNYVCMSEETAIAICKKAMEIDCVMCDKTREESLRCPLRKLINDSLNFEPPMPDTDNCIYAQGSLESLGGKTADELLQMEVETT